MAEDIENTNKPDVILNKKAKSTTDSKDTKRKVVVKVSKGAGIKTKKTDADDTASNSTMKVSPKQVVKKVSAQQSKIKDEKPPRNEGGHQGKEKINLQKEPVQVKNELREEKKENDNFSTENQKTVLTHSSSSETEKTTANTKMAETKPIEKEKKGSVSQITRSDHAAQAKRSESEKQNNAEVESSQTKEEKSAEKKKQAAPIDFFAKRPNIKAGNLADNGRNNKGHHAGRGNNRNNNKNSNNTQGQGRRRESNFSGAQARAYSDVKKKNLKTGQGQQNRQSDKPKNNRQGFGAGRSTSVPAPIPVETNKQQTNKKAHKQKKEIYTKKNKEDEFFEEKLLNKKKKQQEKIHNVPKQIEIMETISVSELAKKMTLKASDLIAKLMGMGMMVSMNQSIDADTATILASEYDCDVKIVSLYDETVIESKADDESDLEQRPPVVTIMGHVDHGKTKTLDAIRRSNVTAGEFGGITQHIGAYTINTDGGKITFLDTPGHEAFTKMRARGASITDIVVLVVAADDGVMPQTIEAINHARDAKVPIIVAVNKIDKPEANVDKVKTRLSELGLMPEQWGGDTMFVEISALKNEGIDTLLETILLQAEVLELKANYKCNAEGKVIESRIDHGRGVVATIIVQKGILRTGDPYVAGIYSGRVRAIFNDRGEKVQEAYPSMPVEILGLEQMPNAGDPFQVTDTERLARQISDKRKELKRFEDSRNVKKVTLDNLYETIHEGEILELKVIIKADVQGSAEALKQNLEDLSTPEIRLNVIHASAGAINDSDVMLAAADSNALIIGFNVRPTPHAKLVAEQEKVDIRKYTVIYDAVEEMKQAMEGMLSPDIKEEVIGMVEIRDTFKVPKIGKIAGCYVLEGCVKRNCQVHVIRDGIVVYTGKLSSLKRFKDDAKEVAAGFECGIGIENFNEIQVGDQLEIIEMIEVARKLSRTEEYKAPEISEGKN